jgi:hypothetical protein
MEEDTHLDSLMRNARLALRYDQDYRPGSYEDPTWDMSANSLA